MDGNLPNLEKKINASAWLRHNNPEPCIGDHDCPAEAEGYGGRGQSIYTAFVKIQGDDIYGCKYDACHAYSIRSFDEAVRHQRYHHFNHSPFVCEPISGNIWCIAPFLSSVLVESNRSMFTAAAASTAKSTLRITS